MKNTPTYEKETVSRSIARLKKADETYEIIINPENALKFRHGDADIRSALESPHVYRSIQSGELASEALMQRRFKTSDESEVAKKIIMEGELHFNDVYKDKLRLEKREQLFAILLRDAVDQKTGLPIDQKSLASAVAHAHAHIDIFKKVEEQLPELIEKIKPVISLSLEKKRLVIHIPAASAGKLYGFITRKSRIVQENWLSNGDLSIIAELAPGQAAGLVDHLEKETHGSIRVSDFVPQKAQFETKGGARIKQGQYELKVEKHELRSEEKAAVKAEERAKAAEKKLAEKEKQRAASKAQVKAKPDWKKGAAKKK